jgi:hypothetical protein
MSRTMILAGAGLAGCLVLGSATVALAADGSPSPSPTAKTAPGVRAKRLCKREPRVATRVDKLIARFSGDATTRGSVLWVKARADKVRPRDAQLAAIIDGRAQIRQSRITTLKLRKSELAKVASWCSAHGYSTGS